MRSTKTFAKVALAMASALVLHGCGGDSGSAETGNADFSTPVQGDWVIVHQLSDPEGLNPLTTNDAASRDIFTYIFEPVCDLDFKTYTMRPVLLESLPEVSDDKLSYTFRFKKNVKFSDGTPATAKDMLFTLKAVKNPLVIDAAALRNYFAAVKDAQLIDDYTLTVSMEKPYFLADLSLGQLNLLPKHVFDPKNLTDKYTFADCNTAEDGSAAVAVMQEFATWFGDAERKREPKYMIGTGPYKVTEWLTNERIKLERNENYWNASNDPQKQNYPNAIVFKTISDRTAAVTALKSQDIDFMSYIPPELFEDIDTARTPHLRTTSYDIPSYTYIGWNSLRPQFNDKKTRQALSHLVNKDQLIKSIMRGYATETRSPIYNGLPEYDNTLPTYSYDVEKAKALLTEAGWKDSDGNGVLDRTVNGKKVDFKFTFLINAGNEIREKIAVLLSDEFRKVGIQAEVQKLEWSTFLDNTRNKNFDACILAWVNDPTPPDPYQIWHSSQSLDKGSNYISFNNKRVDQILEQNRVEFDAEKRKALMKEFQQIIAEEQPYTFLWLVKYPTAYNSRLQNMQFSAVRPGYNILNVWVPKALQKF